MYSFKRKAIEEKIYPNPKFSIPILANAFYNMVRRNGRITESWLVIILALKSGIMTLFNMSSLGIQLLKTGRMRFGMEKIKNRKQVAKMFEALEDKS